MQILQLPSIKQIQKSGQMEAAAGYLKFIPMLLYWPKAPPAWSFYNQKMIVSSTRSWWEKEINNVGYLSTTDL